MFFIFGWFDSVGIGVGISVGGGSFLDWVHVFGWFNNGWWFGWFLFRFDLFGFIFNGFLVLGLWTNIECIMCGSVVVVCGVVVIDDIVVVRGETFLYHG